MSLMLLLGPPHTISQLKSIFLMTYFPVLGVLFLEPSDNIESCSRMSDVNTDDEIATMFYSRLRNYFVDDSICAAKEVHGKRDNFYMK